MVARRDRDRVRVRVRVRVSGPCALRVGERGRREIHRHHLAVGVCEQQLGHLVRLA